VNKRPFLLEGEPGWEVMRKWEAAGVFCFLDVSGRGVTVNRFPTGESVPVEALEELGEYHDEILSHLLWREETRRMAWRIWDKHTKKMEA
jgi:hypothetical protein